jgi:hypothetical protein
MNDFCYDQAASASRGCLIPIDGDEKPNTRIWINVGADGSLLNQRFVGDRPSNTRFVIGIQRFVQDLTFTPATKNGQAVESWLRLGCRAR